MRLFLNAQGLVFILGSVLLLCCGCTNKEVYNAIQQNRQFECRKLPPTQYEECMEEYSQPYEKYREEREEVIVEE